MLVREIWKSRWFLNVLNRLSLVFRKVNVCVLVVEMWYFFFSVVFFILSLFILFIFVEDFFFIYVDSIWNNG